MKNEILYQNLVKVLGGLVPEIWDKILVSAEVDEYSSSVYFYYYPHGVTNPVYNLDIEGSFSIDITSYEKMSYEMTKVVRAIWDDLKAQTGSGFQHMTFIVESSGKFSTEYSYEELLDDPVEKKKRWMEKYLI